MPREKRNQDRRARLSGRNKSIREAYAKLWGKGYRNDYIIQELTKTYPLSELTLEDIVFERGKYAAM